MASYKIGQVAGALGVSVDSVRRWVDSGRLASTRTAGGHRVIESSALAGLAAELWRSGSGEASPRSPAGSARNRLAGVVTAVKRDGVMAQVEIQAGPHRIVSLITREAADDLGLVPGVLAVAAIKSTSVMIERPA